MVVRDISQTSTAGSSSGPYFKRYQPQAYC